MKTFILDVDTGVDDAFAIIFAARHPEINLIGITCVDGNTNLKQVVINTLKVLDAADGKNIPVSAGATRPLIEEPKYAEHVHGKDGLADLGTPNSKREVDPRNAVELLRDLVESSEDPVTLIPLAPLTNIALFVRTYPETAKKLEKIVLMGGSASGGNATASAEFNIWHDPESAAIVFNSGIPITMYGLDVFNDLKMNQDKANQLLNSGSDCGVFAGKLIDHFIQRLHRDVTLGDYGAVAVALYPNLATVEKYKVVVDTTYGPGRGQTVCDKRPYASLELAGWHKDAPEVEVVLKIEVDEIRNLWMKTIIGN